VQTCVILWSGFDSHSGHKVGVRTGETSLRLLPVTMTSLTYVILVAASCLLPLTLSSPTQPLIPYSTTYLGTGYNLLSGNPEGEDLTEGGLDPGLKPTKQVLTATRTSARNACPTQATCTLLDLVDYDATFATNIESYVRETQKTYTLEENNDVRPSLREKVSALAARGSKVYKQIKKSMLDKEQFVAASHLYNFSAEASYNYRAHPQLNPEFIADLCYLPVEFNQNTRTSFFRFLHEWGTHVIVQVRLGVKQLGRSLIYKGHYLQNVFASSKDDTGKNITLAPSGKEIVISVSKEALAQDLENIRREVLFGPVTGDKHLGNKTGSESAPVPISMRLQEISYFISSAYLQGVPVELCHRANNENVLKQLREAVEEAIEEYFTVVAHEENEVEGTQEPLDLGVRVPLVWPSGSMYSLLMPYGGCPDKWEDGTRVHNLDRQTKLTQWSRNLEKVMKVTFEKNFIELSFCSKESTAGPDVSWGKGSYCIFRKGGSCPYHFNSANLYFDDEDEGLNSVQRTLPDGRYIAGDTDYNLCCRADGRPDAPIILPISKPFILLPISNTCQKVLGMVAQMHWIFWDPQHDGSKGTGDPVAPWTEKSGGNIKIFVCHYKSDLPGQEAVDLPKAEKPLTKVVKLLLNVEKPKVETVEVSADVETVDHVVHVAVPSAAEAARLAAATTSKPKTADSSESDED